jgi:hypothetical protein
MVTIIILVVTALAIVSVLYSAYLFYDNLVFKRANIPINVDSFCIIIEPIFFLLWGIFLLLLAIILRMGIMNTII